MVDFDITEPSRRQLTTEDLLHRLYNADALVDLEGNALDAGLMHSYIVDLAPPVNLLVPGTEDTVVGFIPPSDVQVLATWLEANFESVMEHHSSVLADEYDRHCSTLDEILADAQEARKFLGEALAFLQTSPALYQSEVARSTLGNYAN